MTNPLVLETQKEIHRNLLPFTGDSSQDVDEYIRKIESIGSLTKEPDDVLHILLRGKFTGHAEQWYIDNADTLNTWSKLQVGLRERFKQLSWNQTLFINLDQYKQDASETVSTYYDNICRLCKRVDPNMSNKMIVYFLQKGIRDDMKANIARVLLNETDPTPEMFLRAARIEEQLHQVSQSPDVLRPYFSQRDFYPATTSTIRPSIINRSNVTNASKPPPQHHTSSQPLRQTQDNVPSQVYRQRSPCLVCGRSSHRTIDCIYRQMNGCFKCGNPDHVVRGCPQVFIERNQ